MPNAKPLAVVVLVCLAVLAGCKRYAVELTRNGRPKATIVIGDGASEEVRFAAQELRNYVAKVSGAELPEIGRASCRERV